MSKFFISATWSDVPHLGEEEKQALLKSIPPYQRDSRTKGIPQLGSGAIYPLPESDIVIPQFPIPESWPRAYGLDVGWNRTAAVWGARDIVSGVIYMYSEHYRGQAEPSVHAQGIKSRGAWIPGVIDPAARGRSQWDGKQLLKAYKNLGLDLSIARNALDAGIFEVWQLLSSGKLKIFRETMPNLLTEFRLYSRDKDGKIRADQQDHLLDALRYFVMSARDKMKMKPSAKEKKYSYDFPSSGKDSSTSWMQ